MKHYHPYTFDTPIWSDEQGIAIGYMRTTLMYELKGSTGNWTYDPGDYTIDKLELVDCSLADFCEHQHRERRDIIETIDAIATAFIVDYVYDLNANESAEIEREYKAIQETNQSLEKYRI